MVFKRSCKVTEHRICITCYRHQVSRRRHLYDLFSEQMELLRMNTHMKSRAHVESHRNAVQFGHQRVFQTSASQLVTGAKDFGTDKTCHVIDNHPCSSLPA